ncbi:MAG: hydroxyethylthiazole kinase [Rhodospirillaceae bacterium]|nr:MAG: hydroxyethylthiazole kinase [Rhodospirillaceae bacterium]
MTADITATLPENLQAIRDRAPLIHNITNLVVTNVTANALLALGASPAMVENTDEVAELARVATALVVNLGTISSSRAASMRIGARAAVQAGKPWVLDPVAVGALGYRSRLAAELLADRPTVIRGNASEITALAAMQSGGTKAGGKGVDSTLSSDAAVAAAKGLAGRSGAVVVVSGAVDYVTDGQRVIGIANGHPIMTRVTGMGCTATALIAPFLAVASDAFTAAVQATIVMGVAGDTAMEMAGGPGSFQVAFLDVLYALEGHEILAKAKLT